MDCVQCQTSLVGASNPPYIFDENIFTLSKSKYKKKVRMNFIFYQRKGTKLIGIYARQRFRPKLAFCSENKDNEIYKSLQRYHINALAF